MASNLAEASLPLAEEGTSADKANCAERMNGGRRMDRQSAATSACRVVEEEGNMALELRLDGTPAPKSQE